MSELIEDSSEVPPVPEALVAYLEKTFPLFLPPLEWSERRIWLEVGKRRVVEFLRAVYDQQQNR